MPDSIDGGADQHVELAGGEALHHLREQRLRHLAVADNDAGLRRQLTQVLREVVDAVHAIMHDVRLPAALQLVQDRLAHDGVVPLDDVGSHRLPALGRLVHRRHVTDAGERHVQGARDRRRREREHVHLEPHALEPLLVRDAEALLLIDHHQPQVSELDARVEQPVGADDDVDVAVAQPLDDGSRLRVAAEAREHLDPDGEGRQPFAERAPVLLGQHRGGDQDRDLVAVHHRPEGRAQGDFRLAEPNVPADHAIHRARRLHVRRHGRDRLQLIRRLLVGERGLQLVLPLRIRAKGVARHQLPCRVQPREVRRDDGHRLAHTSPRPRPLLRAEPRQSRRALRGADVARDTIHLGGGDVEPVLAGIAQLQVVALLVVDLPPHDAGEAGDAVIRVHDEVAGLHLGEEARAVRGALTQPPPLLDEAEQLAIRRQRDDAVRRRDAPSFGKRALDEGHRAAPRRGRDRLAHHAVDC